ncbi:ABC transporter ATP-binding protein [Kribbella sp. NPDC050820]|uniref:ABC transporter ATP-binding protein n=1 Tax=Kribbella sp. NPDC050820 TaxID=3155408 RepID=UPI00340F1A96
MLEVDHLSVEFAASSGVVHAVRDVSYSIGRGETLAILGESGSGKSVSAQAVMGILDSPPARITGGAIRLDGEDLLQLPEARRRRLRGAGVSMVFQDALTALNPVFPVGWQIAEMFRVHRGVRRAEAHRRAVQLLDRVGIPRAADRAADYPHQFSGGMRQRVMIAMALALDPQVLIADEPTTALDVTVQLQIMTLLKDLQAERSMALVLITHDLGVVGHVADRVAVMYAGSIVETGPTRSVLSNPAHPYTKGLMRSVPTASAKGARLEPIAGSPPDLARIPSGCAFHPRCPRAEAVCKERTPMLTTVAGARHSACHFAEEVLHARTP